MATPKKKTNKVSAEHAGTKKTAPVSQQDLFDRINKAIAGKQKIIFWGTLALTTFLCMLMFNFRLDIGGDDSSYVDRAHNLVHEGTFPSFQGPLYPIVLAPFVAIFGINIFVLKLLSVIFTIAQVYFIWKAFKDKAPLLVLVTSLFLLITNYYILSYASLTYSEAFYMMLQAILIWFMAKKIPESDEGLDVKKQIPLYLSLSFLLLLMFLSRTVGIVGIGAVSLYFMLQKRWKSLLMVVIGFGLMAGFYVAVKNSLVSGDVQFESQGQTLMLKDPYKPELGNDDIDGFMKRFTDNSKVYLSKRLMQIVYFKEETNVKSNGGLAFFVYLLAILGLYQAFKKNKTIFFTGILCLSTLILTFFALQVRWDQLRLVLIVLFPLSILIFFGIYSILKNNGAQVLQILAVALFAVIVLRSGYKTLEYIPKNITILKHNIKGDIYYGYTEDWHNFAKMSSWVKMNLPDSVNVLSRKSSMSKLFADGRPFKGVYVVPSTDPDSCYQWLVKNEVDYVLDASLRRNPYKNTGQIITTIRSILYYTSQKRPNAFTLIHTEGTTEPAYLYKVNYD